MRGPDVLAFVSYARTDLAAVERLRASLELMGCRVWMDLQAGGGRDWWAAILEQVRSCDLFIAVLSPAGLDSVACTREREYAAALGKPILPIRVAPVSARILPPALGRVNVVDYTKPDTFETGVHLTGTVRDIAMPPPLPDPLPPEPPVPLSYLAEISELVHAANLSLRDQMAVAAMLREAVARAEDLDDAIALARTFADRDDLYARVHIQVQNLLPTTDLAGPGRTQSRVTPRPFPPPETRYASNGAIHLAYQVLGSGPPNLLVVQSGPNSHVDCNWMEPSLARFMRRLASFSRLIMYDNRGAGLSDPIPGSAAPTMDQQVDDIRAILDETGCQRAVLAGLWAGCAPALVFAATHPGRVESLILLGGFARLRADADYPQGLDQAHVDQIADAVLGTWGTGADLGLVAPTVAADENFRRWYAQLQRMAASPATAAAMARQWTEVDVRSVLPAIRVPTLVTARADAAIFSAQLSRYLADHIVDAKYVEFPGADLFYFVGHAGQVLDAIEEFVTGMRPLPSPDRFLGTVLFVDVAGSTQLAAEIGDSRFRELIDGFHQLVQRQLDRYQGRLVNTAGDGALTLFDSPARAIACAEAVRDGVRALGLQVRAGVHTGEMEHGPGGEVRGIAVHTGARVAGLAGLGEILVSRTIRDLVAGAPIQLESRGVHQLKGVPGSWEVFAVAS